VLGEAVFDHQHGQWEQDYRDTVPARTSPPKDGMSP
jgi:hypothetical protein